MNKEYWFARWQNNEIGFNQLQPNPFLLQFFPHLNLKLGSKIFVPLCGKSIDMFWLARQGYQIIGVELNLQACRDFFTENEINYKEEKIGQYTVLKSEDITLLSGNFFDLNKEMLGRIDAIYDRAALEALPFEIRPLYAQMLIKLKEEQTPMLLITASYDQSEMQGPPFSVDEKEITNIYGKHFHIERLLSEPIKVIADHLKAKGLKKAQRLVLLAK
jgi:thiopurine S-methyltransferase